MLTSQKQRVDQWLAGTRSEINGKRGNGELLIKGYKMSDRQYKQVLKSIKQRANCSQYYNVYFKVTETRLQISQYEKLQAIPGMVVHTYNPGTLEAEAEES